MQCTNNVVIVYGKKKMENGVCYKNFFSNEFIVRSSNYKLHTQIYYKYYVQVMSN